MITISNSMLLHFLLFYWKRVYIRSSLENISLYVYLDETMLSWRLDIHIKWNFRTLYKISFDVIQIFTTKITTSQAGTLVLEAFSSVKIELSVDMWNWLFRAVLSNVTLDFFLDKENKKLIKIFIFWRCGFSTGRRRYWEIERNGRLETDPSSLQGNNNN